MDDIQMNNSLSQGIKGMKYDASKTKEFDKSLEELIASRRANIKVVGVGGSGNDFYVIL